MNWNWIAVWPSISRWGHDEIHEKRREFCCFQDFHTLSEQCLLSITFPLKQTTNAEMFSNPHPKGNFVFKSDVLLFRHSILKRPFSVNTVYHYVHKCEAIHINGSSSEIKGGKYSLPINFSINVEIVWDARRQLKHKGPIFTLNCDGTICAPGSIQEKLAAAELMSSSWAPLPVRLMRPILPSSFERWNVRTKRVSWFYYNPRLSCVAL